MSLQKSVGGRGFPAPIEVDRGAEVDAGAQAQHAARLAAEVLLHPEDLDEDVPPAHLAFLRDMANKEIQVPTHLTGTERKLYLAYIAVGGSSAGISKKELYHGLRIAGLEFSQKQARAAAPPARPFVLYAPTTTRATVFSTPGKQLLELWRAADADESGFIDFEEFTYLAHQLKEVMNMALEERDDYYAQKDAIHQSNAQPRVFAGGLIRGGTVGALAGPALKLDADQLGFEGVVGTSHERHVTMTNSGTTSLFFAWEQTSSDGPFGSSAAAAANACFVLENPTGILFPGKTHTSKVIFRASVPGIFFSSFVLKLTPELKVPTPTLALHGVATSFGAFLHSANPIIPSTRPYRVAHTSPLPHQRSCAAFPRLRPSAPVISLRSPSSSWAARAETRAGRAALQEAGELASPAFLHCPSPQGSRSPPTLPAPPLSPTFRVQVLLAVQDILFRDVLSAVYVIADPAPPPELDDGEDEAYAAPADEATSAAHVPAASSPVPDTAPAPAAAEAARAGDELPLEPKRWAQWEAHCAANAAAARLPDEMRCAFTNLDALAAEGSGGGAWSDELNNLARLLIAAETTEEMERMVGALELVLLQLAAPPLPTSGSERRAMIGRRCVMRLLDEATSAVSMQRKLFGKPGVEDSPLLSGSPTEVAEMANEEVPEEAAAAVEEATAEATTLQGVGLVRLMRGGVQQAYCWETQTYEPAEDVAQVVAAVRTARAEAVQLSAERMGYEERKLMMSKREKKNAENKETEQAAAAAREAAMRGSAEAEAGAAVQAQREADPVRAEEQKYVRQLEGALSNALREYVLDFVALCVDNNQQ